MEIAINACHGGFSLSPKAIRRYAELSGFSIYAYKTDYESGGNKIVRANDGDFCIYWIKEDLGDNPTEEVLNKANWLFDRDIPRDDKNLISVIKEMKKEANGQCAELKVVKIPDGIEYEIAEYDGYEHIAEQHRTWS